MRRTVSRIISLVLVAVILVSSITATVVSAEEYTDKTNIPVIYVVGQGIHLIIPAELNNGEEKKIYPVEMDTDYLIGVAEENVGMFVNSVFTQDWSDFCDLVYDEVIKLYGPVALDENGQPKDGSVVDVPWSREEIESEYAKDGEYRVQTFEFPYDWRLDPYQTADDLHAYIETVLDVTGAEKVALMGRCLGACITMAYMEKYEGEYVEKNILYCSAFNGATQCSKLFAGEMYLDADGVERFVYDLELGIDEALKTLLNSFVTIANDNGLLDLALWSVNNVYGNIYLDIMPRLIRDTFGTFPGYWSMVSEEDYERAKEVVFYGSDAEKYANFISIIDNYHYNVQAKGKELIAEWEEKGIETYNIVKYGYQSYPITTDSDKISDSMVFVEWASMGATCAEAGKTLANKYIQTAEEEGRGKYISPDKQIDASTGYRPDRTWYIKGILHKEFPDSVNLLAALIVNNEDFLVSSNPDYPQFMVFEESEEDEGEGPIVPMTGENHATESGWNKNFFEASYEFMKSLFDVIISAIKNKAAQAV